MNCGDKINLRPGSLFEPNQGVPDSVSILIYMLDLRHIYISTGCFFNFISDGYHSAYIRTI